MPKKTADKLSTSARKAVRTLRRKHPGGSSQRLDSQEVRKAFRGRGTFSTGEIMKKFGAAVGNATAVAAILSRAGLIKKVGIAPDGTTAWGWA